MWGEPSVSSLGARTAVRRGDRRVESEERELTKLDRAVVKLAAEEGVNGGLAVAGVWRGDWRRFAGGSDGAV